MKMRLLLGALMILSLPAIPVWAENLTSEEIKKLVDEAVEKRLQQQEGREGATERLEKTAPTAERERTSRTPAATLVVRVKWIGSAGIRQAVPVVPQSHRGRLLRHSISNPPQTCA
jgi:uncharacterized protein YdaT